MPLPLKRNQNRIKSNPKSRRRRKRRRRWCLDRIISNYCSRQTELVYGLGPPSSASSSSSPPQKSLTLPNTIFSLICAILRCAQYVECDHEFSSSSCWGSGLCTLPPWKLFRHQSARRDLGLGFILRCNCWGSFWVCLLPFEAR